jgi:ParB/RepB/Spo0J family partition protein
MTSSIQTIALSRLRISETGAQAERRKRFDKAAIDELAESIKTIGLLQPIVARQVNGHFEIVAGERRYLAAKVAGIAEISVNVRELTDQQVLEVQLIENLQREGLHELVEAEGYEALMKQHGYTVDDLVAKVGKSRAYIYARLKLTALGPAARQAFFDGKLSASCALLVARIPDPALQRKACGEVINGRYDGPMSYRQAADHIQRTYMLKLGGGGFPTGDASLVPAAGACGACPKRTGNQPELFGDVKGGDVCTDPPCYQAKRQAWAIRQLEEARAQGRTVIEGKQAAKIAPHGAHNLAGGYVGLDEHCYQDDKGRTYRQILGKGAETTLLQVPKRKGDEEALTVIEVVQKSTVAAALKAQGVKSADGSDSYRDNQKARDRKAKRETDYRWALFNALRAEAPATLKRPELELVAIAYADRIDHDSRKRLFKAWGWEPKKSSRHGGQVVDCTAHVKALVDSELAAFLLDCTLVGDLYVNSYSMSSKPERLLAAAKRLKVDAEKIRSECAAAERAKAKPAKKK